MGKYIKPTLNTKFHIDFSWWEKQGQNLAAFLRNHACSSCQDQIEDSRGQMFDWVSPETGEVHQINILWYIISTQCGDDSTYVDPRVPLTSAIFRAFILNNNIPLTPIEIYEKIQKKSPETILRTIGARRTYKGIKPVGN